jgi:hypothetical protein
MRISSTSLMQKIFGTPKKQQQQQSATALKKSPEFLKPTLPTGNHGIGECQI